MEVKRESECCGYRDRYRGQVSILVLMEVKRERFVKRQRNPRTLFQSLF